jgi:hypothetical protein
MSELKQWLADGGTATDYARLSARSAAFDRMSIAEQWATVTVEHELRDFMRWQIFQELVAESFLVKVN